MSRGPLLAIPSVISLSRIALAAAFIAVESPHVRAALVIASALTDFLDGWIARTGHLETRIGAIIDPITDRLFMLTAIVVLVTDGALTVPECAVLLLRDIATTVGFFVARIVSWLRPVPLQARFPGKVATLLQFLSLLAALLWPVALMPLVVLVGAVAVWAIADYTLALWRARATA
jgi:CDP-diacylglycerol--glycerol-3-phosphate 3-phosphatidyltransferase/cardiolipin synthase